MFPSVATRTQPQGGRRSAQGAWRGECEILILQAAGVRIATSAASGSGESRWVRGGSARDQASSQMAEIFPPGSNTVARAVLIGAPVSLVALVGALYAIWWSPWMTRAKVPISQPVPFSHKHHVGQLGIDCRYCHTSVEKSAYAGMPPTETCMTCHSQLYTDQDMLAPVRQSLAENKPIKWNRVHDLPDFVYFNHSIHVNKGIGCVACHGRVNEMQLIWQDQTLYMAWCLQCHRHPEQHIAPRETAFSTLWMPSNYQGKPDLARKLVKDYKVQSSGVLTDCYTCHR